MWKNMLVLIAVALLAYYSYQQGRGKVALDAYQARDEQVRQYGSECLPVSAPGGKAGWSYNLQLVLNQGKGKVFSTQADCEREYQATFGKSPRRQ
jgi:hypothetical protein